MIPSTRRSLPRSGLEVTILGLGCAQMGGLYRDMPLGACQELLKAAWDAGIRYVDTAPYYGYTRSERRVGTLLDGLARESFVLSTKVGRLMLPEASPRGETGEWFDPLPFRPRYDYSYDGIMRSFEASQQRLGMIAIDVLYVHDIGRLTHGAAHAHYWEQLTAGGGFRALGELRADGRVRAVGLGVNEWEVVSATMDVFDPDITMLAGRYTLLEQTSLGLLDRCRAAGHAIVAAGVFNSGILAGTSKFNYAEAPEAVVTRVRQLQQVCAEHGVPLSAAALQFPLHHPAVVSCVVGARSAAQLAGNLEAFAQPIPPAFWSALKTRGLLEPDVPTGEAG